MMKGEEHRSIQPTLAGNVDVHGKALVSISNIRYKGNATSLSKPSRLATQKDMSCLSCLNIIEMNYKNT